VNILIAASYAAPQSGNFIASLIELGRVLRQRKNDVFFIFPKSTNTLNGSSWLSWLNAKALLTIWSINLRQKKIMLNEINALISKHNIDVLHTHFGMYERIITHYRKQLIVKKYQFTITLVFKAITASL